MSAQLKPCRERGIACNNLRLKPAETQSIKKNYTELKAVNVLLYLNMTHPTLNLKNERTSGFPVWIWCILWLLKIISKQRCGGSLFGVRHKMSHQGFTTACLTGNSEKGTPHRFLGKCETCELLNDSMPAHYCIQIPLTRQCLTTKTTATQRQRYTLNDSELRVFCFWLWGSKAQCFAPPQKVSQWVVGANCCWVVELTGVSPSEDPLHRMFLE